MRKTSTIGNLALAGYDDIFASSIPSTNGEIIVQVPLTELQPPEFHPFQVNDDEAMDRLAKNVAQYGVREPGVARPLPDGYYELLCGNRRKRACELAGLDTMPVIIREMDDDNAVITMVDSNLEQREALLFSEKAWAYRVKLEALNHNGIKGDSLSVDVLVQQTGESKNQIFRYVRLTELIIGLLDMVDTKQLAFNPAVQLSYLSLREQTVVLETMKKYDVKPSLSQAMRLKKLKQSEALSTDAIDEILSEEKSQIIKQDETTLDKFRPFFPAEYTVSQMESVITQLLTQWKAKATA